MADSDFPASGFSQLHLDNQVCFQLYTLSRMVTQSYQPLLKPLGLTYPQYLVMLVLWQKEEQQLLPCPIKSVTQDLMLDTGTVTPLLKRMEGNGLIVRTKGLEDERQVLVGLSAHGQELKQKAASIPAQLLCEMDIPQDQLVGIHQQLGGVMQLLKASKK